MSRSVNKVFLVGNLTKDAEIKYTQGGTPVSNFTVATNYRFKNRDGEWDDKAEFHKIVLWKKENLAEYLTKGTKVHIEGRLQTRSWEDQNGNTKYMTEIVADNVILLGGGSEATQSSTPKDRNPKPTQQELIDDEVPF